MPGINETYVLALAALASANGGQDPVDAAIRAAAMHKSEQNPPKLVKFIPFDPAKKMSESSATDGDGQSLRIVKGAYRTIIALTQPSSAGSTAVDELEKQGFRVLLLGPIPKLCSSSDSSHSAIHPGPTLLLSSLS